MNNIKLLLLLSFLFLTSTLLACSDEVMLDEKDNNPYIESIENLNPIAMYLFNSTFEDSMNGNHGESNDVQFMTLENALFTKSNTGNIVAKFDGNGAYLDFLNKISERLNGASAITFETWFNNWDMGNQKLMSLYVAGNVGFEVYLNNGIIGVAARPSANDPWKNLTIQFKSMNTWHHLVTIVDFEKSQLKIYLDGDLARVIPVSGWKSKTFNPNAQRSDDYIGSESTKKFNYFGLLKNTAIYDKAIDAHDRGENIKQRFLMAGGKAITGQQHLGRITKAERLKYRNPLGGFTVNLAAGYGVAPLPIDLDDDGDYDMLFINNDVAHDGLYFAENKKGNQKMPIFSPPVYLGTKVAGAKVAYTNGKPRVFSPNREYPDFKNSLFSSPKSLNYQEGFSVPVKQTVQWIKADLDGDGKEDIIISGGSDNMKRWETYDNSGNWRGGVMNGHIYWGKNIGTNDTPSYKAPEQLYAGGKPIDVYGMPTANFVDFDGDGDLDIICGDFLDKLTYFENIGTKQNPIYKEGKYITHQGKDITIDGIMQWTTTIDWNKDGFIDIIVGDENGWIMFLENTGKFTADNVPIFLPPEFFQQTPDELKVGSMATPFSYDWDGDGYEDIICGDGTGRLYFIKNLDGGCPPKWAKPIPLQADGQEIRILAGYNGSIQGPCESKWGYTVPVVADWNHDGLPDIIVNDIWGQVHWYQNIGTRTAPKLAAAKNITVDWNGNPKKPDWIWWQALNNQFVTQWRTTPFVYDLNGDGINDLIMLDKDGYLSFLEREKQGDNYILKEPQRIFETNDHPFYGTDNNYRRTNGEVGKEMRLNERTLGASGRRKFVFVDWDLDGKVDILINSESIDFFKNVSEKEGEFLFKNMGAAVEGKYAGHDTCPTVVYWKKDGIPDLLFGGEDGCFYYAPNPYR